MSFRLGIVTRQIVQTVTPAILTPAILVLGMLNVTVCVAQQSKPVDPQCHTPLLNVTDCTAQQPAADKPPVPEAQPDEQKPAEQKPAAEKPAAKKPAAEKPAEQKTAEPKTTEPAVVEPEAAKPETADPETVAPKAPKAKEAAKAEPAKPATEPAAKPPAEGAASGEEVVEEGPEPLAEKFAELLAEIMGDKAVAEASPEPAETEAAPEQDPVEAVAPVEIGPPTISVLVLRNPDDLMDVKPTDHIGQLILSGDAFTNRSLRNLKGLTISELSIEAVNVSSAGLQYLKDVRGISRLRLWSPGLDDQALSHVAKLSGLEVLDIEGTAVEGARLEDLKGLPKLGTLVMGPKFADLQIGDLEQLPALRQLDMRACGRLTLAGVESLSKLVDLEIVWLPRHVRTKGKRILRAALPECQIRS